MSVRCLPPTTPLVSSLPLLPEAPSDAALSSSWYMGTFQNETVAEPAPEPGSLVLQTPAPNTRIRLLGKHLKIFRIAGGWNPCPGAGAARNQRWVGDTTPWESNDQRSMRRACSKLNEFILAYDLGWMLTLTFETELSDCKLAWKYFTAFIRRARRQRRAFPFVVTCAVQHERAVRTGAPVWHFHVAIGENWQKAALDQLWHHGNADCCPMVDEHGELQPRLVSQYLQRNLRSTLGEQTAGHRYRTAKHMRIDVVDMAISEATLDQYLQGAALVYDVGSSRREGRTVLLRAATTAEEALASLLGASTGLLQGSISLHE